MPKKSFVVNGRRYLKFEDEREQALYDKLFDMGSKSSPEGFDINDYEQARGLATVEEDGSLRYIFSAVTREDAERSLYTYQMVRNKDGVLQQDYYSAHVPIGKEAEATAQRKKEWEDLKKNDPAAYEKAVDERLQDLMEGRLRYSIGTMAKSDLVIMDPKRQHPPRMVTGNVNKQGRTVFSAKEIPPVAPAAPKPPKPKAPALWERILNTVTGGWARKDSFDRYKAAMEQYRNGPLAAWEKKEQERQKKEALSAAVEKDCPGFRDIKEPTATAAMKQVTGHAHQAERLNKMQDNLIEIFGATPEIPVREHEPMRPVYDRIEKENTFAVPEGFTPLQAAVVTHAAFMSPEILKDFAGGTSGLVNLPDKSILKDRYLQMVPAHGHIEDVQFGRDAMELYAKDVEGGNCVNRAHALSKQAFEAYVKEGNPDALGKVIADGVEILTPGITAFQEGATYKYMGTAKECDALYTVLKEHPDVMQAAQAHGLNADTLQILEANHNIVQQYARSEAAYATLLEGKEKDPAKVTELVADVMAMEHISSVIRKDGIEKERVQDAVTMEEFQREENRIRTEMSKFAMNTDEYKALQQEMTVMASMTSVKKAAAMYKMPVSDTYRLYADSDAVDALREAVKASPTAKSLCSIKDPAQLANELANITADKKTNPQYAALLIDLNTTVKQAVHKATLAKQAAPQQHTREVQRAAETQHNKEPAKINAAY